MKKIIKLLTLILCVSLTSCLNDDDFPRIPTGGNIESSAGSLTFGAEITSRFIGKVVDQEEQPLSDVRITIGSTTVFTDAYGIFSVPSAQVYEKFAYIKASKFGYINGSRALVPSGELHQVEIMLLKETPVASISSGEESVVSLDDGSEIVFQGDFTDTSGAAYTGTVDVIAYHLSPDDEDMALQMPGMLYAQDTNGEAKVLETYGMLAVELRSSSGEELQLAAGTTATLKMPIASGVESPPATMPLWYFDEVSGYWIEEGMGTLESGFYIGEVSHFSFWNYDFPHIQSYLCLELVDSEGNGIPFTQVQVALSTGVTASDYTDDNGIVCGAVPINEQLFITIPSINCDGSHYETTLGPFTSDQTIVLDLSATDSYETTLNGTFNHCDDTPVTNGYLIIGFNGEIQIVPVTDGTINHTLTYCESDEEFTIQGVDLDTEQTTDVIYVSLDEGILDLGSLMSCVAMVDSDGDTVFDIFEDLNEDGDLENDDTDGDGIPDYLDNDDDNDGIFTQNENYDGDFDPRNDDTDEDGIPNYLDADDVTFHIFEAYGVDCAGVGVTTYDIDGYIRLYTYQGILASDLIFSFHLSESDALNNINPIDMLFVNIDAHPVIFGRAESTITGQFDIGYVFLLGTNATLDNDDDGLLDCEEITGIDDPFTECSPEGYITDPFKGDTDDDTFTDCEETYAGSDPTDASSTP